MKRAALVLALMLGAACASMTPPQLVPERAPSAAETLTDQPLHEVANAIAVGEVTSLEMTMAYLARIKEIDRAGPTLQSVLAINPNAVSDARKLDSLHSIGVSRGPLHGVPILIKDNIETKDPIPTTAGALALKDNLTGRDAPLIAGLRAQGAVILGKTNLSQWANFRSEDSISGWSALGGQVRNPHALDRSPCGSSSGSGAAVAAFLAAGAVGTETNGSIICPASLNGIVGFKPTVGVVSQDLIIPISPTQDTAGPMTLTVRDAALMMNAMATIEATPDYTAGLSEDALNGVRIGVLRPAVGDNPEVAEVFEAALWDMHEAGATLVDITEYTPPETLWDDEYKVLLVEFKASLNAYLSGVSQAVTARTLADVIAFNETVAETEMPLFDQSIFEMSQAQPGLDDPGYVEALTRLLKGMREDGIDRLLAEHDVDLLVAPSEAPAFLIDPVHGDSFDNSIGAGWAAAIAGYPHLTVPMGTVRSLPVGVSFIGTAGDDADVLAAGYAYEVRSNRRVAPAFRTSVDDAPGIADAMTRPAAR